MRRSLFVPALVVGLLAAGCSSAAAPTPQIMYVTQQPAVTASPTPAPTPKPTGLLGTRACSYCPDRASRGPYRRLREAVQ